MQYIEMVCSKGGQADSPTDENSHYVACENLQTNLSCEMLSAERLYYFQNVSM